MQLVIADTGPVNYLLLIGHIGILPALFEKVILPSAVKEELANADTPLLVREWIGDPPSWVEVRPSSRLLPTDSLAELGAGETAAITLAVELHADLLLMDDRRGVTAAAPERPHRHRHHGPPGPRGKTWHPRSCRRVRPPQADQLPLPAGNHGPVV